MSEEITSQFVLLPHRQTRPSQIEPVPATRTCDDVSITAFSRAIHIPPTGKALREIEGEAVELTLRLTQNNQSAAARILGISRPTLLRKLREHGLRREIERRPSLDS